MHGGGIRASEPETTDDSCEFVFQALVGCVIAILETITGTNSVTIWKVRIAENVCQQ